jgi:hypothetical protein
MGTWLNVPSFTIEEADTRSDAVYEVLFKDWGLTANSAISTDQWPPKPGASIPTSIAGVSIGPRSMVDRAWLTYNLQKPFDPGADFTNIGKLTPRIRQFSVGAPLLFTQACAPGTRNVNTAFDELLTMAIKGSLYVWPNGDAADQFNVEQTEIYQAQRATTVYSQYKDIFGITRDLGPTGIQTTEPNASWVGPLLHLLFYLKGPFMSPPTQRAPLKAGAGFAIEGTDEVCIGQFAVFGRKSIHLMVQAGAQCDFRVAALRTAFSTPAATYLAFEEPVDSAKAVPADTPAIMSHCVNCCVYADYLLLYAKSSQAAQTSILYTLSAYD